MGQNSTEVAYGFGQMGSVFSNGAKDIVPPQGMVICAIQFLADNTPTTLTSEKHGNHGPSFANITGSTTDVVAAADRFMNFNGVTSATCTNGTYAAGAAITIGAENLNIKVGQYVLLVDTADAEGTGIDVDEAETPVPIYNGANAQGTYVTAYTGGTDTLKLSAQITPSSQDLIFLDEFHGAGGTEAAGVVYPKGITIYGRWTHIVPSAAPIICYFGK
mgnify:CR=1 FL=1